MKFNFNFKINKIAKKFDDCVKSSNFDNLNCNTSNANMIKTKEVS